MIKTYKYKLLLLSLALTVVLSTATFSVSYALWSGSENELAASVNVGEWQNGQPEKPGPIENGIGYYSADGSWKTVPDVGFGIDDYNPIFYIKSTYKEQRIYLALDGVNFTDLIFLDSSNSVRTEDGAFVLNTSGGAQWYSVSAQIWKNGDRYEGVVMFDTLINEPDIGDDNTHAFVLE